MKNIEKCQKIADEILDKKTIIIFLLEQQAKVQRELNELEIELKNNE